jgi:hypothetical protein
MRGQLLACLGLMMGAFAIAATPATDTYAEGQVWEYKARPQDKGSLLKIQKIEALPEFADKGSVYHVSIIGLNFNGLPLAGYIQHAPFTKGSLDASVTRLSSSSVEFPDASGGIAEWKRAQGGVFTVTVAEAVSFVEQMVRERAPLGPSSS